VDEVSEVMTVSAGSVEALPDMATTVNSAFIKGIAKLGANGNSAESTARLIILLNLDQVLSTKEQADLFASAAV
jgi:chemotaxis signal transduction protein